jgi:hypothetical protein
LTVTVTVFDEPPSVSPGVPAITPVVESIEAQAGRPEALKVRLLAGISPSVAKGKVDEKAVCSDAVWSAIAARVG